MPDSFPFNSSDLICVQVHDADFKCVDGAMGAMTWLPPLVHERIVPLFIKSADWSTDYEVATVKNDLLDLLLDTVRQARQEMPTWQEIYPSMVELTRDNAERNADEAMAKLVELVTVAKQIGGCLIFCYD